MRPTSASSNPHQGLCRASRVFGYLALSAVILGLGVAGRVSATVYVYENGTSGGILTSDSDGACTSNPANYLERTFVVLETFTPTEVAVGIEASHLQRGDIRATLIHPNGTTSLLVMAQNTGDDADHYSILISSNTDNVSSPATRALDDDDIDPLTEPFYHRLVTLAGLGTSFDGLSATGIWRLRVCDRDPGNNVSGTLERARLVLSDAVAAPQVCTGTPASYEWGDNGQAQPFVSATFNGITMAETSQNDLTNEGAADAFTTQTGTFGAEAGHYLIRFDTVPANVETVDFDVSFSFSPPVRDLRITLLDVDRERDRGAGWEDYTRLVGLNSAGNRVPYTVTNGTANQLAGDLVEADSGNIADTSPDGNVLYAFIGEVASIGLEYWQGDDNSENNSQRIGIGNPTMCAYDFGDAPATYGTQLSGTGTTPKHVLGDRSLWLGANRPDGESDSQPGAATSDDGATVGGVDDEDGVASFPACPDNGTYSVTVSASDVRASGTNATLVGYIDWNRNNVFENNTNEESASVTVSRTAADPSSYTVTWSSVPANCGGTAATYARFRFTTDAARAASPTDSAGVYAPDGEVEDYAIAENTLPVTLAWIETAPARGGQLAVRFMTATETLNVGFRVWGVGARGERTLLARVPSGRGDSLAPQSYEVLVGASGVAAVEIEDVAIDGATRRHGPFALGKAFGERPEGSAFDWEAIRRETGIVSDAERMGAAEAGQPAVAALDDRTAPASGARLLVRETGVHRVTYEELLAAGVDLTAVPVAALAITDNGALAEPGSAGGAVAVFVGSPAKTFGPGAFVEFVARPRLTLESPVDVYEIKVDRRAAVAPTTFRAGQAQPAVVQDELRLHADRAYSPSAPNGDPWFDEQLLAWGAPATLSRSFDLPDLAAGPVSLTVDLWGYGDFPGDTPDHHVVVRLNGEEIATDRFDGIVPWSRTLQVAELARPTDNLLEIEVPGDVAYEWDLVAFEGLRVAYPRASRAIDGRFRSPAAVHEAFSVDGFGDAPVSVWHGSGSRIARSQQMPVDGAVFAPAGTGEVFAAASDRMLKPAIVAGIPAAQKSSAAEYLIITHPVFADALAELVALEESRGLSTEVVTTDRIFAAFSDHASSSDAVQRFIAASYANRNLRYVLLVGADTADPYDHLGLGSVSYVPTAYRAYARLVPFSPTDEVLADANGDGVAEVSIGRFPVRTPAEIDAVVEKLQDWERNRAGRSTALLVSGASSDSRSLASINGVYADALASWSPALAQVDDLGAPAVRGLVLAALRSGTPLVSFVGHSSPGLWDFTPLLRWQDVPSLGNAGRPNLITQWGCWSSYYVDPAYQSLSSHLLLAPGGGAVGTIGATTLTSEASHQQLGRLFFEQLGGGGASTVGEAFLAAKRRLKSQGRGEDAILGMTLLGDPAMSLPSGR